MIEAIKTAIAKFWENHICMDFDKTGYPDECFVCNEGNCEGCPLEGKFKV